MPAAMDWKRSVCCYPQCRRGGAQSGGTLIAPFRTGHGGDAFQAPGGIGDIAQPLVERQAFPVADLCTLVVLLLAGHMPQQGEDVRNAPGHVDGSHIGESFFQELGGTRDIPSLACQLSEIEQGK